MADTFNTQGGYFSPTGYFRIDAGGSHEENPNGGVQIGVDNQGIPNMLEEGESVYEDFVYSDRITADASVLEQFNIPAKFAGKLYSEIADSFVSEAEDRPLDTISNKGLNAMLVRLADAQEAQKQKEQEAELEKELEQLTPEELEALDRMLAQEGTPVQEEVPVQEEIPVDGMSAEPQIPVMAEGGLMHSFDKGGDKDEYKGGTLNPAKVVAFPGKTQAWVDAEVGPRSIKKKVREGMNQFVDDAYDVYKSNLGAQLATGYPGLVADAVDDLAHGKAGASTLMATVPYVKAAKGVGPIMDEAYRLLDAEKAAEATAKITKAGKNAGKLLKNAGKWAGRILLPEYAIPSEVWKASSKFGKGALPTAGRVGVTAASVVPAAGAGMLRNYIIGEGIDQIQQRTGNNTAAAYEAAKASDPFANVKADGGLIRTFDDGTPGEVKYKKGDKHPLFGTFVEYADDGTPIWDSGLLKASGVNSDGSEFHETSETSETSKTPEMPEIDLDWDSINHAGDIDYSYSPTVFDSSVNVKKMPVSKQIGLLPTGMMYAGVLGNAVNALYNAFQPADKYTFRTLQAREPEGRMRQQHFRYNPISLSLLQNAAAEQARGDIRAALASGAGPSTNGLLLAMDKNYTTAMGDALVKGMQANLAAYNDAISHNNEADARQAAFNYQVDAAKKQALEEADRTNLMIDMRRQIMNNEAEQAKYNAVQVPLDNLLSGLAGIGRQNFAMNQLNRNRGILYGVLPNGDSPYKVVACGGKIHKPNKK